MKSIALAALLTAIMYLPAFAQAKAKSQQPATSVEQTILRIEKEMLDALLRGDASASEKYLAGTFVFTAPDGAVGGKAQGIADIKSGTLKLQAASIENAKVQVYGDTAIVTYGSTDKGTYKGKDISGRTRWTDVFVKQNGQWKLVAGHGSSVRQ